LPVNWAASHGKLSFELLNPVAYVRISGTHCAGFTRRVLHLWCDELIAAGAPLGVLRP